MNRKKIKNILNKCFGICICIVSMYMLFSCCKVASLFLNLLASNGSLLKMLGEVSLIVFLSTYSIIFGMIGIGMICSESDDNQ